MPQENEEGPLSKFNQVIQESGTVGKEFIRMIERSEKQTLFAPSNAAWDDGNIKNLLRDPTKLRDILNMHLVVDQKLPVYKILDNNRNHVNFIDYYFLCFTRTGVTICVKTNCTIFKQSLLFGIKI